MTSMNHDAPRARSTTSRQYGAANRSGLLAGGLAALLPLAAVCALTPQKSTYIGPQGADPATGPAVQSAADQLGALGFIWARQEGGRHGTTAIAAPDVFEAGHALFSEHGRAAINGLAGIAAHARARDLMLLVGGDPVLRAARARLLDAHWPLLAPQVPAMVGLTDDTRFDLTVRLRAPARAGQGLREAA